MADGRFDLDVMQFELDQARRRRDEQLAAAEPAAPMRAPLLAWAPVFIWMMATCTVLVLQA